MQWGMQSERDFNYMNKHIFQTPVKEEEVLFIRLMDSKNTSIRNIEKIRGSVFEWEHCIITATR